VVHIDTHRATQYLLHAFRLLRIQSALPVPDPESMLPRIQIVEILCLTYRVKCCTQAGIYDFVTKFFCKTHDRFLQCALPLCAQWVRSGGARPTRTLQKKLIHLVSNCGPLTYELDTFYILLVDLDQVVLTTTHNTCHSIKIQAPGFVLYCNMIPNKISLIHQVFTKIKLKKNKLPTKTWKYHWWF
jgi:hypothetical protein